MNLAKLFEMQHQLDEYIEQKHPRQEGEDRLAKKILALQVELGELGNCWRGFKFWSHDKEPRTIAERGVCVHCAGTGNAFFDDDDEEEWEDCSYCKGEGEEIYNPLLEEYVDCLHFILSIGLEIGVPYEMMLGKSQENETIEDDFINLYHDVLIVYRGHKHRAGKIPMRIYYESLLEDFISLGERLGFTWEQVEEAYMKKHAENIARQERGY